MVMMIVVMMIVVVMIGIMTGATASVARWARQVQ
jgi:hypothetical protein